MYIEAPLLIFSVQIEVDTVTMTEEYQIKELAVLEKASQFKKEVDLVLVDINSLSAVLKKLNTGEIFTPLFCYGTQLED